MNGPNLFVKEIPDPYLRKNFQALLDFFQAQGQLNGFKFFEKVFTKAETGFQLTHGLGVVPLDVLVTHISGPGSVTFQYGTSDSTNLVMDASDACRIRFFVGTYAGFTSGVQTGASESQKVSGV